jgi:hypothetical protein
MVLRIKSLDTRRKEENTQEKKVRMGKETEEFKIYTAPERLESFTLKSKKQRKNLNQG